MMEISAHKPVLYHDIILALKPKSGGFYVDGTLGAGGHAFGILESSSPKGVLLGLDVDPQAIDLARTHLASFGDRAIIVQGSYTTLSEQMARIGWTEIDGMVLDLGASSMQFKTPGRGFSFLEEGELDMRFDPNNPLTARYLVNETAEVELADLLFQYGEEPRSRQIARAIVSARPLSSTIHLAKIISKVTASHGRIHPATRTFQALRIAVNDELKSIGKVLPQAVQALGSGGRLAVISFHSLEDRIIKHYFRMESRDCICPPRQPDCTCGHKASIRQLHRKPIIPSDGEVHENPRARSAKLRYVEKI
jgi:16S rRNA (cytosine1402-N4)-methyltransferase